MQYYFRVYTKGVYMTCVYTSQLFDDRSEAEKEAAWINKNINDRTAVVYDYHPLEKSRCFVNAEEYCIDD